jgi:hypothetical protein
MRVFETCSTALSFYYYYYYYCYCIIIIGARIGGQRASCILTQASEIGPSCFTGIACTEINSS